MSRSITRKNGKIIVRLSGYSEYYDAIIQGAIDGAIVHFPAKWDDQAESDDQLYEMAREVISDAEAGTDNASYYGAKIVRRGYRVQ
jgi:hypothetical protein